MLTLALNIQPVKALQTIYIRANGSVDPPAAPVSNVDNVTYTITANIYSYFVVVQRDNIMVDGARHLLYGDGAYDSKGIDLTGRRNVTITNCRIQRFGHGIFLSSSLNNTILGNNISGLPNNRVGISISSSKDLKILGNYIAQNGMALAMSSCSNSTISGNNIENNWDGLHLEHLSNNTFCRNNITGHESYGIRFYYSTNNIVSENNITNSGQYSIELGLSSSYNYIYHNNFGDKPIKVYAQDCINVWDIGYPSGGNYCGDYVTKYPDAQELDDSGIWDTPYVVDENNQDNYPLMEPWTPTPPTIMASVDIDPDTLNLQSTGKWITAYTQLPEGYSASDIDATSILLNDTVAPISDPKYGFVKDALVDYNRDGVLEYMLKFDRATVTSWIYQSIGMQHEVKLTITGELTDGTPFEGTDIVSVVYFRGGSGRHK